MKVEIGIAEVTEVFKEIQSQPVVRSGKMTAGRQNSGKNQRLAPIEIANLNDKDLVALCCNIDKEGASRVIFTTLYILA